MGEDLHSNKKAGNIKPNLPCQELLKRLLRVKPEELPKQTVRKK